MKNSCVEKQQFFLEQVPSCRVVGLKKLTLSTRTIKWKCVLFYRVFLVVLLHYGLNQM